MNSSVIESALTQTSSILLILFTYVIPLLSSIRTIHNRDKESYTQWLTYWLLIYFLSPFFHTILHSYRVFHLSFILWLSLPRFQGASVIYNEFVDTFLDRYSVEQKVDHRIYTMKKSIMDAMWNIAKDVGWGFLYQIGGVVSYVQDTAASFVDQNTTVSGKSQHGGMEDDNETMKDRGSEKYDETEFHDDAQNDEIIDSSENSDEIITDSNENDNDENVDNEDEISSPQNNDNIETSQSSSSVSMQRSQPIHSVLESYSSLSSLEADLALIEKEKYIHDFIDMLKKGLYVFAWCNDCSIINHSSDNGPQSTSMDSKQQDESRTSKKYQLRVLKLVETSNQSAKGEMTQSFVLNPVESRLEEEGIDIISFPVSDISGVRESRRGIQFMTKGAKLSTDVLPPETTMSLSESSTSVTSIVSSATPEPTSASLDAQEEVIIREQLVAEVVLSDDQDKDILLFGLNIFLSRI